MTQPPYSSSAAATETVLITGASSGIGRALAELFAADGANLVLVARSEDRLRAIADDLHSRHGVQTRVVAVDLARPNAAHAVCEQLQRDAILVDVLVNNAGFGTAGHMIDLDLDRQLAMIQLNVVAATQLMRLLLPGMVERGRGGVLNIASVGGFLPGPNMAVYYATKAYVLSLSEALAEELAGTPVRVTCLAPGPTHTGFAAEAGLATSRRFKRLAMTVEVVAQAGYKGFRAGQVIVIPGRSNRAIVFLTRLLPRSMIRRLSRRYQL